MQFQRRKKINPLPFIVLFGSIAVVIGSYLIFKLFFSEEAGKLGKIHLNVDDKSRAEVQLSGGTNWNEVFGVSLQEGDTIRAKRGEGVKVTFFENTVIALDEGSVVKIERARQFNDGATLIKTEIIQGRVWVKVPRKINPRDKFMIFSSDTNLIAETTDASFSFAKNKVAMTEGDKVLIGVSVDNDNNGLFSEVLRVGQMITFSDEDFEKIKAGEKPSLITMITDEFRNSDWFVLNTKEEEVGIMPVGIINTNDSETTSTSSSTEETTNKDVIVITKPNNGDDYRTALLELEISGTVTKDAAKVIVDDYTLQKFKKGDVSWSYKISKNFGNRESKVYYAKAYNDDGKMIGMDSIEIIFTDLNDSDNQVSNPSSTTASSESLKITKPTEDENYETSDSEFFIEGSAPAQATKIVVSGFTLSRFKKGNTTWSYRVSEALGNRGNDGDTVTYDVKAYDENNNLIGSDLIKILYKKPIVSGEATR